MCASSTRARMLEAHILTRLSYIHIPTGKRTASIAFHHHPNHSSSYRVSYWYLHRNNIPLPQVRPLDLESGSLDSAWERLLDSAWERLLEREWEAPLELV